MIRRTIIGLRRFGAFWYDFVVGDDWRVAIGVVAALALTYGLSTATSLPSWWVMPAAVAFLLTLSLRRAIQPTRRGR
jgi:hypothetical protein